MSLSSRKKKERFSRREHHYPFLVFYHTLFKFRVNPEKNGAGAGVTGGGHGNLPRKAPRNSRARVPVWK
jgi:hypothetical protein